MKALVLIGLIGLSFNVQALTVRPGDVAGKTNLVKVVDVTFEGGPKKVLADMKGMSIYTFDLDKRGESVCKGGCLTAWPPIEVPAGAQTLAPFGVIKGNNGKNQLTLDGFPLYYFRDAKPGDVNGHYPEWQLIFVN